MSASTRRIARDAQRGGFVVSGDWRLGDRVHATDASVYGGSRMVFPLKVEINQSSAPTKEA